MADSKRRWRNATVGAAVSAMVLSVGGVTLAATADASSQPMVATTWVNMRSGPGMANGSIAVLSPQQKVTATGRTSGGWVEVAAGAQTGWVYRNYLNATAPAQTSAPKPKGAVTTTARVNVRVGPGLDHEVITLLPRNTRVATTGKSSGPWTQVIYDGQARWMFTEYLTTNTSVPKVSGQIRTIANLYLRTGGDMTHHYTGVLQANSIVDTTGRTTAEYTEIVHGGESRWIATRYTAPITATSPSKPSTPTASGKAWVSVGELYLRAGPAPDATVITSVYRGDELGTTGVTEGDRTQVIYQGVARWAYSAFISTTAPTPPPTNGGKVAITGYDKLTPRSKAIVAAVTSRYPAVRTIHGWRASSNYSSDHPNGRAVDVMIPDWRNSGADYGWDVARYFQKNAGTYKIRYIIWRQQIWSAAFPNRGWRAMEDRGSSTANHYDHVHISVYA